MNIVKNTAYYYILYFFTTMLYHPLIILNNSGEKIAINTKVAIKIKLFYFTISLMSRHWGKAYALKEALHLCD